MQLLRDGTSFRGRSIVFGRGKGLGQTPCRETHGQHNTTTDQREGLVWFCKNERVSARTHITLYQTLNSVHSSEELPPNPHNTSVQWLLRSVRPPFLIRETEESGTLPDPVGSPGV